MRSHEFYIMEAPPRAEPKIPPLDPASKPKVTRLPGETPQDAIKRAQAQQTARTSTVTTPSGATSTTITGTGGAQAATPTQAVVTPEQQSKIKTLAKQAGSFFKRAGGVLGRGVIQALQMLNPVAAARSMARGGGANRAEPSLSPTAQPPGQPPAPPPSRLSGIGQGIKQVAKQTLGFAARHPLITGFFAVDSQLDWKMTKTIVDLMGAGTEYIRQTAGLSPIKDPQLEQNLQYWQNAFASIRGYLANEQTWQQTMANPEHKKYVVDIINCSKAMAGIDLENELDVLGQHTNQSITWVRVNSILAKAIDPDLCKQYQQEFPNSGSQK